MEGASGLVQFDVGLGCFQKVGCDALGFLDEFFGCLVHSGTTLLQRLLHAAPDAQGLEMWLTQLPQPPFVGASSSLRKITRRYKAYSAGAGVGASGVQAAVTALVQENQRARRFGFTATELERGTLRTDRERPVQPDVPAGA